MRVDSTFQPGFLYAMTRQCVDNRSPFLTQHQTHLTAHPSHPTNGHVRAKPGLSLLSWHAALSEQALARCQTVGLQPGSAVQVAPQVNRGELLPEVRAGCDLCNSVAIGIKLDQYGQICTVVWVPACHFECQYMRLFM